jgi:uncharacterized protein GlcG (DUF336 family)
VLAKQLTLEAAERVIEAGKKGAEGIGQAMCIAVHDGGANLVAFVRMTGPCWCSRAARAPSPWARVLMIGRSMLARRDRRPAVVLLTRRT